MIEPFGSRQFCVAVGRGGSATVLIVFHVEGYKHTVLVHELPYGAAVRGIDKGYRCEVMER
jgi:hypothetical protein